MNSGVQDGQTVSSEVSRRWLSHTLPAFPILCVCVVVSHLSLSVCVWLSPHSMCVWLSPLSVCVCIMVVVVVPTLT